MYEMAQAGTPVAPRKRAILQGLALEGWPCRLLLELVELGFELFLADRQRDIAAGLFPGYRGPDRWYGASCR